MGPKGKNTLQRIKNLDKNPPLGKWRNHEALLKIEYTYVLRGWTWRENEEPYTEKHFSPWGMVMEVTEALKVENVGNSFVNLPVEVKKHYPDLTKDNFSKEEMVVKVANEGNKSFGTFRYVHCTMCKKKSLIPFLKEFKDMLPENATIEDFK